MRLFRRASLPSRPRLFEPVKAGDPIVLDEEERAAVDSRWNQYGKDLDGYYPANVAQAIEKDIMAVPALMDVAKSRLQQGDYRGAASTCTKAIGLRGGDPYAWLLLAEIHAEYGDLAVADNLLTTAEKVAKGAGAGKAFAPSSQRVRDGIALRSAGLTGTEEEMLLLRSAEINAQIGDLGRAESQVLEAERVARDHGTLKLLEQLGILQRIRKKARVR